MENQSAEWYEINSDSALEDYYKRLGLGNYSPQRRAVLLVRWAEKRLIAAATQKMKDEGLSIPDKSQLNLIGRLEERKRVK